MLYFVFMCFAEDIFTLTSNKFRMVYKVDGNSQLDSRDWSMYLNILKSFSHSAHIVSHTAYSLSRVVTKRQNFLPHLET